MLEEPAVADERGIGGGGGDEETGITVQESQPKKVSPHKAPGGAKNSAGGGPPYLFRKLPLQIKICKIIDLAHVAADVRIGIVKQLPRQRRGLTLHFDGAMFRAAGPLPFVT